MNLKYCCPRNAINGLAPWMLAQEKTESDSNEADWLLWHTASKIFHTQRPFSVLTLLAFDDEMYYICIEIWEEPRLPPFFVTFPLKTGILEAHPVKICLPLVLICLPQILIRGRQRKTMCRVGKIGRRKVFSKVKNVNVESLKKRSKFLDFSARSFLFPLHQCSWMGSSKRLSFFGGARIVLVRETRIDFVWTRIVQN